MIYRYCQISKHIVFILSFKLKVIACFQKSYKQIFSEFEVFLVDSSLLFWVKKYAEAAAAARMITTIDDIITIFFVFFVFFIFIVCS